MDLTIAIAVSEIVRLHLRREVMNEYAVSYHLFCHLKITRQSREKGTFGKGVEMILIQPEDIKHLPAFAALAYVTDLF